MTSNQEICDVNQLENTKDISNQVNLLLRYLKNVIATFPTLTGGNAIIHKGILDTVLNENNNIEAIWTNDTDGTFIYSNPPAGIANASIRDWYNHAAAGEIYQSEVYTSAISNQSCITVSMPIKDDFDQVVGVIGADIGIEQ